MKGDDAGALRVAIVGSGPAALYTAAELVRVGGPDVQVNMIDRLPTIGGLVRAGVAPDHADRRQVIDVYEKLARSGGRFRFHGNVEVGRHVSHAELLAHHHAVIYAIGASGSRPLDVPGANLSGCHPSSEFVGWYNGHPDHADLPVSLDCERAVVIGNGNVALDVARILLKGDDALVSSDIAAHAREALATSRIREVCVLGRRGPAQAAFTHPELLELGDLEDVSVQVDPAELASVDWRSDDFASTLRKATLETYARSRGVPNARRLLLRFMVSPIEVLGRSRVEGLRLVRNRLVNTSEGRVTAVPGERSDVLQTGLVVHAIGYRGSPPQGLPFDTASGVIPNCGGRMLDGPGGKPRAGQYVVGWIKRGPRGVIGSNKLCARETVRALMQDAAAGELPVPVRGGESFSTLIHARQPDVVSYRGWKAVDRFERQRGQGVRPREKLTRVDDMLRVARSVA